MQVYADNAATTRMSDRAVQAMLPLLQENFGNPSSLHSVGQRAKEALENAGTALLRTWASCQGDLFYLRRVRGGQPGHSLGGGHGPA